MKTLISTISLVFITTVANAKIWRVNNNPGTSADFNSLQTCVSSASVMNDDTVHVEPSNTNYGTLNLNKRLVIIGTGYFLSGTNANTAAIAGFTMPVNTTNSYVGTIYLEGGSAGSQFISLQANGFQTANSSNGGFDVDNIEIKRCYLINAVYGTGGTPPSGQSNDGWKIKQCYINTIDVPSNVCKNWEVTNNIIVGGFNLSSVNNINNLVRNNYILGSINLYNAYFTNNIISSNTLVFNNCVVKNNTAYNSGSTSWQTTYQGVNGNNSVSGGLTTLVQGLTGNSTDGQYRLLSSATAVIANGETISGVTPDRGAFGTADPYRLSGLPPIPIFYGVTVPAAVATNATSMNITISVRSNN